MVKEHYGACLLMGVMVPFVANAFIFIIALLVADYVYTAFFFYL